MKIKDGIRPFPQALRMGTWEGERDFEFWILDFELGRAEEEMILNFEWEREYVRRYTLEVIGEEEAQPCRGC